MRRCQDRTLAREQIEGENCSQHAEHYFRVTRERAESLVRTELNYPSHAGPTRVWSVGLSAPELPGGRKRACSFGAEAELHIRAFSCSLRLCWSTDAVLSHRTISYLDAQSRP